MGRHTSHQRRPGEPTIRLTKAQLEEELEKLKIELEQTRASVAELEQRAAQADDRLLRLRADFDNYKKRVTKEKAELSGLAKAEVLERILPVLDSLTRAQEAAQRDGAPAVAEGIRMVTEQFLAALAEEGVQPIESVGRPFDPLVHEVVRTLETDEVPEGYVACEDARGFRLGERVVRPAKVATAVPRRGNS